MNERIRKIIFVSGINQNLVGLKVHGFELKCTKSIPTDDTDRIAPNKRVYDLGRIYLGLDRTLGAGYQYVHNDGNGIEYYLYFEKVYDHRDTKEYYETCHLINCLRLFCNSTLSFYCPLSVNEFGGTVAMGEITNSYHNVYPFDSIPVIEPLNIEKLNEFYEDTFTINYGETLKKMLDIYHDSFRMHSKEMKLIQRVTILEMLVDGNAELTHRIRHTVSVFLGRDVEESRKIDKQLGEIYTARSKYLHEGSTNRINDEVLKNSLDLTRRVIANFMYIECDIKDFRLKIKESGYGTNPFDVKF